MSEEFIRSEILLGTTNIDNLKHMKVAVFGIGGVGSYVVEALARTGIGSFVLVDDDIVAESNINRQLIALHSTIGKAKVEIAKERILDINPQANVYIHKTFYQKDNGENFIDGCNYVVDAIDTVSAKLALIEESQEKNIPIISSMGAGNKLDPTMFEVSDIYKTEICPLCRVIRKELKTRGIKKLKVVYSKEKPIKPQQPSDQETSITSHPKRQPVGSVSFVPSVAGLIIAAEVIKDLANI